MSSRLRGDADSPRGGLVVVVVCDGSERWTSEMCNDEADWMKRRAMIKADGIILDGTSQEDTMEWRSKMRKALDFSGRMYTSEMSGKWTSVVVYS